MRALSVRVSTRDAGVLIDVVAAWLPGALGAPVSRAAARRLVMAGAIRVDGAVARRPGQAIAPGARLDATVREELLPREGPSRDRAFSLTARSVLFEDEALIAVDKPPGLPTQPTVDPARPHLLGLVQAFLERRDGAPAYVGLHQRLDRDTSGVVLFTKAREANAGVAAQIAERTAEKVYHALTTRPRVLPPERWVSQGRLEPTRRGPVRVVRSGGQPARTSFVLLETARRGLRVEARLESGRKHQIRVHLAARGLPVLGDPDYGGGATDGVPRLMLHAHRLALRHPLSGLLLVIESPEPADFRAAWAALLR